MSRGSEHRLNNYVVRRSQTLHASATVTDGTETAVVAALAGHFIRVYRIHLSINNDGAGAITVGLREASGTYHFQSTVPTGTHVRIPINLDNAAWSLTAATALNIARTAGSTSHRTDVTVSYRYIPTGVS